MAIQKIDEKTYAFGKYNGRTLVWDVIGEDENADYQLLLCREIVCRMAFDARTNEWGKSELRGWLNSDFLYSFDKEEKDRIVLRNDDYFFLLSKKEYNYCEKNIINSWSSWWLRGSRDDTDHIDHTGVPNVFDGHVYTDSVKCCNGVRPAVLMLLPLSENKPQSDTEYYITNIRRCTHPGGFEYEAEPTHEIKKFYCDDVNTTEKLWKMAKDKYKHVKLSFDKTTNNNNDLKRLIDIYD